MQEEIDWVFLPPKYGCEIYWTEVDVKEQVKQQNIV